PWVDAHAFRLDGDTVFVGQVTDGEGLGTLHPVDVGLCTQFSKWCAAEKTDAQRPGNSRSPRLVRRRAQYMVEHHCAHPAVHETGWALVGRAEGEVAPHIAVRSSIAHQGPCDGIG